MTTDVREIPVEDTHDLRRAVLRRGSPDAIVEFPQDAVIGTFHLGAVDGDAVVAVATFIPTGSEPSEIWQLRGMAVDEELQGSGVGRAVLDFGVERVRERGARLLWANVRDTAAGFYERMGWTIVGHGFVTDGVAHHVGVVLLDDRTGG